MTRMSTEALEALEAQAAEHNLAVAEDIQKRMEDLEALEAEFLVVDTLTSSMRDKMTEALRVFKHQYNTNVKPKLGLPAQTDAEADAAADALADADAS